MLKGCSTSNSGYSEPKIHLSQPPPISGNVGGGGKAVKKKQKVPRMSTNAFFFQAIAPFTLSLLNRNALSFPLAVLFSSSHHHFDLTPLCTLWPLP